MTHPTLDMKSSVTLICIVLQSLLIVSSHASHVWQDQNLQPKIRTTSLAPGDFQRFTGNTSHEDHFKLLSQDGDSLLVGARNMIYNISLASLEENRRLEWYSPEEDVKLCRLKGKSEDDCHNYIRVLAKKSDSTLLVCGTNSFKPRCRDYLLHSNSGEPEILKEQAGEGLCPYDPHHNSTAVFAEDNLYVATVAQFSGADPLIYRSPLRTEQFNPKHLNQPNFVNSIHYEDHVYFFLRETAVEYINCGKTVYSRVARVCTKDKGGPHKFKNHWTSFVKARLNCSIPGDFPFYFDEIREYTVLVVVQTTIYVWRGICLTSLLSILSSSWDCNTPSFMQFSSLLSVSSVSFSVFPSIHFHSSFYCFFDWSTVLCSCLWFCFDPFSFLISLRSLHCVPFLSFAPSFLHIRCLIHLLVARKLATPGQFSGSVLDPHPSSCRSFSL